MSEYLDPSSRAEQHSDGRHNRLVGGRHELVLVVEDQEYARAALTTMLLADGYRVIEASNGREALTYLATGTRPDVILLDLIMPIMDGWEFLGEQQNDARLRAIPTIVVTGVPSHYPRCLEMPLVRFLSKPFTVEQVLAAVETECAGVAAPRTRLREGR